MKQQFLVDKTDTIRLTVYSGNRPVIPSSAYVTLYTPSGSELQAEAAATVDSTTGEMTYSLTTTHTDDHDLNYKAVWRYIVAGSTYYETQLFDVVKSILSIPITDDDLYAELESLRKTNYQVTGTATGAAAGTLIDTAKLKQDDDYWKGGVVEIIDGTGDSQKRIVTGSTQSTATLAVSPDWTTTPDTTSVYRVVKSYTQKIEQAFDELCQLIYNKGQRHSLIMESSQIKSPLIYLTLEKICRDLSGEVDDKYDRLAATYAEKFETHFGNMKLDYDRDESGSVDSEEERFDLTSLRIGRA